MEKKMKSEDTSPHGDTSVKDRYVESMVERSFEEAERKAEEKIERMIDAALSLKIDEMIRGLKDLDWYKRELALCEKEREWNLRELEKERERVKVLNERVAKMKATIEKWGDNKAEVDRLWNENVELRKALEECQAMFHDINEE